MDRFFSPRWRRRSIYFNKKLRQKRRYIESYGILSTLFSLPRRRCPGTVTILEYSRGKECRSLSWNWLSTWTIKCRSKEEMINFYCCLCIFCPLLLVPHRSAEVAAVDTLQLILPPSTFHHHRHIIGLSVFNIGQNTFTMGTFFFFFAVRYLSEVECSSFVTPLHPVSIHGQVQSHHSVVIIISSHCMYRFLPSSPKTSDRATDINSWRKQTQQQQEPQKHRYLSGIRGLCYGAAAAASRW